MSLAYSADCARARTTLELPSMIENTLNLLLALPAVAIALSLKPWRLLRSPPPWPALAVWAALPLLWSLDATTASPLLQPLSGV